jgi:hypothetical protein
MRKPRLVKLAFRGSCQTVAGMKRSESLLILATVITLSIGVGATTSPAQADPPKERAGSTTSALGENVMYARLDQFFKLVGEGKVKDGYEALTKGSKAITNVDLLVDKTETVIKGNGQIADAELLRTTRVGQRLLRISYITHGDIYPMQWNFYCYRSQSGWQVLDITVNNDLYAIFDEEEKEQAKDKDKDKSTK